MTEESFEYLRKRLGNANTKNPFRALATSIIYQQIHGKAAAAICTRFIKLFDPPVPVPDIVNSDFDWFPTPKIVLDKTLEELKAAGLSTRKAEYIQSLAEKFRDCSVDIDRLQSMSDDELSQFLCSVKGIGQWTVDMFMIFNLGRPNVLPLTDLAVKKAVARHFGLPIGPKKFPTADEMCRVTKIWEPYRTVATLYMWRGSSTVISAD
ncbi:DNA glycosylase [Phycomyces blakesleeanus]